MTSENGDNAVGVVEADLQQARRNSLMAHSIVIMFKEMDLPEDMDGDLASVCTDLGDLWGAQQEFTDRLETMLKSERSWEMAGDALTDLRAFMDHMVWHLQSVREPITRMAEYAYGRDNED